MTRKWGMKITDNHWMSRVAHQLYLCIRVHAKPLLLRINPSKVQYIQDNSKFTWIERMDFLKELNSLLSLVEMMKLTK